MSVVFVTYRQNQKMPKKIANENIKSSVGRQRKKHIDDEKEKKKAAEKEDSLLIEENKKIIKRQQKKEAEEMKKQEHFRKRLEVRSLLENELVELTKKSLKTEGIGCKLTRAHINKNTEKKTRRADEGINLEENFNRIDINENVATTVEDAICILGYSEKLGDKHPEKRLKAAYNEFEERKLKELKLSKPTLRLSQMKQSIFKEWQKSPQNPMNSQ